MLRLCPRHGPGTGTCSVLVLLKSGSDPNAQDSAGRTALHYVLEDEVQAWGLAEADRINHFKQVHSKPKLDPAK
jgi:hypothetical protein